ELRDEVRVLGPALRDRLPARGPQAARLRAAGRGLPRRLLPPAPLRVSSVHGSSATGAGCSSRRFRASRGSWRRPRPTGRTSSLSYHVKPETRTSARERLEWMRVAASSPTLPSRARSSRDESKQWVA